MYLFIFIYSLLVFTSVQANFIKRKIAASPTTVPVGKVTIDAKAQASAYKEGLKLSGLSSDPGNITADTIRLVNFDGCKDMPGVDDAEAQIYAGWQDAQKIMAVTALKEGKVDFNTAGAVDFLGAPFLNDPRQSDMNDVFANFATLTPAYWPFGWRIHVRCDDPNKACSCGRGGDIVAYTVQKDPTSKLARINFCPPYFQKDTLKKALDDGKDLPSKDKYNMDRYWNTKGHAFAHEVLHIDWVAGANGAGGRYGDNEHVTDLEISFKAKNGKIYTADAYGPALTKLLARWPVDTGDYVMRNADNLAIFMTSQYVQQALGNNYPAYPVIDAGIPSGPPRSSRGYSTLFIFDKNGSVTLNTSDPLSAQFSDAESKSSCGTGLDDDSKPKPLMFSSFAPDSVYPQDYITSSKSWLASQTWAPDSMLTPSPVSTSASSTSEGPPYCTPFQDPDRAIKGYCQCSDDQYYSFAKGDDICPYTSPGPKSATLDPKTITGSGIADPTPPPVPKITHTPPPPNASPTIGNSCTPDKPEWGCTQENDEIVYCYCKDGKNCEWTSFGKCEGGSKSCHLDHDGNCGYVGACC